MKNAILFVALFLSCHAFCQSNSAPVIAEPVVITPHEDKIFTAVEVMPQYPGGEEAMMRFIQTNIMYPNMERENDIQGRVVVGFVVNEDGSLSDISIKKSVSKGLDAEALRVVRLMPNFKPGKQQGKAVKVTFMLPVTFALSNADDPPVVLSPRSTKAKVIYTSVPKMSFYSGDRPPINKFINAQFRFPAGEPEKKLQVTVRFIIHEDGSLSDFAFATPMSKAMEEEAIRVLKLIRYVPGSLHGEPVRVESSLSFTVKPGSH
ncbi:MAG: Outer rane transport energization protein TonB [Bacteroidetes bacterium]|nr:Outer rane transport energization protein TonB [Bacteroidota bacterium]